MEHANAPLTPIGRLRLVKLVEEDGLTFEAAAAASNVAKSTAWVWVKRWRQATDAERRDLACLKARPSRPKRSPRMLSPADHDRVCELRRRTGWGHRALTVYETLAGRGGTFHRGIKHPGLLIAAAAELAGVTLVHFDDDYDEIELVTDQPMRRLAPKGSLR